jgi:hypothetical protein
MLQRSRLHLPIRAIAAFVCLAGRQEDRSSGGQTGPWKPLRGEAARHILGNNDQFCTAKTPQLCSSGKNLYLFLLDFPDLPVNRWQTRSLSRIG